jgi:glycosyltransferase involved in cell wall biosynthesis
MLRSALLRAAVVTVPSQAARRILRERYSCDGLVVPVGVAPEFAKRPKRPAQSDATLRIAYVGRRSRDKGFDTFVRLAEAHPEADWIALGDGPIDPGRRVITLSQRSPAEVLDELLRCHALLAPGLRETQGLAVLEALHAGTAVAIPRGSAQAELVREGVDGASYQPGDDAGAWRALLHAADITRADQVSPASGLEESRLVARMTAAFRSAVERS